MTLISYRKIGFVKVCSWMGRLKGAEGHEKDEEHEWPDPLPLSLIGVLDHVINKDILTSRRFLYFEEITMMLRDCRLMI